MSKSKGSNNTISIKRFKNGGVYIKPSNKDMLQQFDLGGFLKKNVWNPVRDYSVMQADNIMGAVGAGDVIKGSDYKTNTFRKISDITSTKIMPVAGQIAANTIAPGVGGAALGAVQQGVGQATYKQPSTQSILPQQYSGQMYDNSMNYQPTFAYGGMMKKYPTGGEIKSDTTTNKSNYNSDQAMALRRAQLFKNGIDSPEVYDDIENDPGRLGTYFSILKEQSGGQPSPYTQRFLINVNNRMGKQPGTAYDVNRASLHINPAAPAWKPTNPSVVDTLGQYKPYVAPVNTTRRAMGNNAIGSYAYGGMLQYPFGGVQPNAELEQGEQYRTPNGDINQIPQSAPTHQEGGVPLSLPENTQILGKMVDPLFGKQFKEIGAQLKKAQDKYKKVLDEKPTPLAKKTAKMMLDKVQDQYDALMQRQESLKQYPMGGMPLMENGRVSQQYPDGGLLQSLPGLAVNYTGQPKLAEMSSYSPQQMQPTGSGFDYSKVGDIANTIGALAPIGYNLAKGLFGKAQKLNATDYQNPYTRKVTSLMANRKYDVTPELEANSNATAQYYNTLRQAAPSQGRYLAGLQSGQIAKQRADQEVYSRANNVNNQYRIEEANTLSGLGQQEAATKWNVQDFNTRAQAAQNAYLPTALSQIQQVAQTNQQTKNQKLRDKQRLALSKEMYKNYPFDLTNIFAQ